jgi:hypothetical protein
MIKNEDIVLYLLKSKKDNCKIKGTMLKKQVPIIKPLLPQSI